MERCACRSVYCLIFSKMMKQTFVFIGCILLWTGNSARAQETGVEGIFPEVDGYDIVFDYPVYQPGNLWDYINGGADAYLSYDFVDLHIAEYSRGGGAPVKVELYRHATPVHAYGIYSQERYPDFHFVDVGAEGYQEGSTLNFVAGRFYVKIMSHDEDAETKRFIQEIARKVAGNIDPEPSLPVALSLFPSENRLPRTETFISQNFMGHEFLSDVFAVQYEEGDDRFTLFLLEKEKPGECREILEAYYRFTKTGFREGEYHMMNDPYNGLVGLRLKGNRIWGISGLNSEEQIRGILGSV